MPVLYLLEQGSILGINGETFEVRQRDMIRTIPAGSVDGVVVFGGTQLTSKAVAFLLEKDIPTAFLSGSGRYFGRLYSKETKAAALKLAQIKKTGDPAFSSAVSSAFIKGKILNSVYLLRNLNRSREIREVEASITSMLASIKSACSGASVSVLRGYEGAASAAFFKALPHVLKTSFGFAGRNRRPPRDPVNSMLSFSYTLLMYHVYTAVVMAGLDPSFGFLHPVADNRPGLALDLMEEFRPIIADQVVIDLVNHSMVSEADFHASDEGDYPVLMNNDLRKKLIQRFEKRISTPVLYNEDKITYRRVFEEQARLLARAVKGIRPYEPFVQR